MTSIGIPFRGNILPLNGQEANHGQLGGQTVLVIVGLMKLQ